MIIAAAQVNPTDVWIVVSLIALAIALIKGAGEKQARRRATRRYHEYNRIDED